MDEDKFALVEKIIKDIDNVMSKNAELCAFDIVPVEINFRNKSPVLHIENCLGLESWCVKHVYMYCYNELMDKYFTKSKRKCLKPSGNSDRLSRLLNITLLLNPELSALWNKRRELVLKNHLEKVSELNFTKIVVSRKPKCNESFAYRRWLLEIVLQDDTMSTNHLENLINEELNICEATSERSPNNYHSWNHRIWIVNTIKNIKKHYDIGFLYIKEYGFSERWTAKHVSDFSCFHYRQFCIKNIFTLDNACWKTFENTIDTNLRKSLSRVLASNFPKDVTVHTSEENLLSYSEDNLINLLLNYTSKRCRCTNNVFVAHRIEVLFYELVLNNELLKFYKFHETLWYHRRFIVHEIILLMYDYLGLARENGALVNNACKTCNFDLMQKQAKIVRYDSCQVYNSVLFSVLISHEKKIIDERRNDGDNYADRHEKYLKFVEGLNSVM